MRLMHSIAAASVSSSRGNRIATPPSGEWSAPYSVPSTVNTSTSIALNNLTDTSVRPAAVYTSGSAWEETLLDRYGMGCFVEWYGEHGAYVIALTGGHTDNISIDPVVFDLSTGLWSRLPNGHGLAPRMSAYSRSQLNGSPYYEVSGASPSTFPAPPHPYKLPVGVPVGTLGSVVFPTRRSVDNESDSSHAAHICDLETRVWTRATTDEKSGGGAFEPSAAYDPLTGRIYVIEESPSQGGSQLNYMDPTGTPGQYVWDFVEYNDYASAPGTGRSCCFMAPAQNCLMIHTGGALQAIDLTSPSTIALGPAVLSFSGTSPSSGNRWVWHPTKGKFYGRSSNSGNVINVLDPGANIKGGTGVFSTITIGGAGMATKIGSNAHCTALSYVPALDCLLWIASASTVNLIKV